MSPNDNNEWLEAPDKAGLVSIGTHKLYISAKGPPRKQGDPIVIIECGLGSASASWTTVQRLLSPSVRVVRYDRAGLGKSETSERPRNAVNIATELTLLLNATGIDPPYVLVCHSYGGVLAREFLAAATASDPDAVVGMVFCDTNQEKTNATLQFPLAAMGAIMDGLDYFEITGLNRENSFTAEERQLVTEELVNEDPDGAEGQEAKLTSESAETLAAKRQLDQTVLKHHPVTVIRGNVYRDFMPIYKAAREKGNGTPEEWEAMMGLQDRWMANDEQLQRDQMRLSTNSRFVQAENSGHHPHINESKLVADEILMVVKTARKNLGRDQHRTLDLLDRYLRVKAC